MTSFKIDTDTMRAMLQGGSLADLEPVWMWNSLYFVPETRVGNAGATLRADKRE